MKKIEIIIGGSGHEITRSKFTTEELNKVKEYCEKNDEDIESILTNDLDEVLEDRGSWYDCDDLGHFMGGNLSCKIYVTVISMKDVAIHEEEYEFETRDAEIEYNREYSWPEFEDGKMVSFVTWEKGTMDSCEFELNDSEEFDIKKLKLKVFEIETPSNVYEIINEVSYNGEPLNGDGFGDTNGKAFDVEIED
jgi:hypothetical protein